MKCLDHNRTPVVSFVGRQNSGKTTFLEKLIREIKGRGYRVGTIKHHWGHFDFDVPGKDTWRYAQAGSDIAALACPTGLGLVRKLDRELPLDEIAELLSDADIIIAEGYKQGSQPKIELVREAVGSRTVLDPNELIAVVTDLSFELPVPCFNLEDVVGVAEFIIQQIIVPSQK